MTGVQTCALPISRSQGQHGCKREVKVVRRRVVSADAVGFISDSLPFLIIERHEYVIYSTLLVAGHETTSSTISWILLELARNPEVQSRLRDEIRKTEATVYARGDSQLKAQDLDAMPYLNAVIKVLLSPWHAPSRFTPSLHRKDYDSTR